MELTNKEQIEGFLACTFPVTKANADRVVKELESCRGDWCLFSEDLLKRDVFAQIYLNLSEAYFKRNEYQKAADTLEEGIQEYTKVCDYSYEVKSQMWHNLGIYQSYQGKEAEALESFRKFIFYKTINRTAYNNIPLYCYKKISEHSIDDLAKSRITLVDPKEFDDPVDCLVFPWMEKNKDKVITKGDEVASRLMQQAFSYVRIKCFVRNASLPTWDNPKPLSIEKKKEFNNVIMWPTYADYHRGMCMEYCLPLSLQQPDVKNERTFFLSDVEYLDRVGLKDEITIKEAFFTKSSEWEFEKETRLLYYDTKSTETYLSVDVPVDSLKKIFFGLRCPDEKIYRVIQALKENNVVEFYKMKLSLDDIYTFTPERIEPLEFCKKYQTKEYK